MNPGLPHGGNPSDVREIFLRFSGEDGKKFVYLQSAPQAARRRNGMLPNAVHNK